MKLVKHNKMIYPDQRDEWCLHFSFDGIPGMHTFAEVKDWFANYTNGYAGWASDQSSYTVFLKQEKEYIHSLLRWS